MSSFHEKTIEPAVERQALRDKNSPPPPPKFRSWKDQTESLEAPSHPSPPKKVRCKRLESLPMWQNKDLQVFVAIFGTGIIAYTVYYFLK